MREGRLGVYPPIVCAPGAVIDNAGRCRGAWPATVPG